MDRTMWKLTSWGFRKCGSFWALELFNGSYCCSKSENYNQVVILSPLLCLVNIKLVISTSLTWHRSSQMITNCSPAHCVHCTLYIAHCILHTAHCTLHIVHHCTLYTAQCTLYTAHFVHCALFTAHCTLHILYTVHCTAPGEEEDFPLAGPDQGGWPRRVRSGKTKILWLHILIQADFLTGSAPKSVENGKIPTKKVKVNLSNSKMLSFNSDFFGRNFAILNTFRGGTS